MLGKRNNQRVGHPKKQWHVELEQEESGDEQLLENKILDGELLSEEDLKGFIKDEDDAD